LHNDLESVTVGRHPELAELKARLIALGAAGALMSGSGPTVFGLFAEECSARAAAEALAGVAGARVFVVQPVGN
jgi:4-diphosphocytidyl-2-C-methyl-D-erythritol kinase